MCCTRLGENTGRKKIVILAPSTTLTGCIFAGKAIGKNLLNIDTSSTCPHNMVNFGLLTTEICWRVWGHPANFNGFRVLAALLQGTLVVGVSQTLRRWTEGATYIRQGDHHVGHWPTFQFAPIFMYCTLLLVMAALCNRAGHNIFSSCGFFLLLLSSFFLFFLA